MSTFHRLDSYGRRRPVKLKLSLGPIIDPSDRSVTFFPRPFPRRNSKALGVLWGIVAYVLVAASQANPHSDPRKRGPTGLFRAF